MKDTELKIFSGNSNIPLAEKICANLEIPMGKALVTKFSNKETRVEIPESVRGADVFVIQSNTHPNDNLMEMLIMIDAFARASAGRITAVMPSYPYARQDRRVDERPPVSARLVADLLETAGANRLLTMDLHAGQIVGFFKIPVDNLYARGVIIPYLRNMFKGEKLAIVSPDAGGVVVARSYAKKLDDADLIIIDKRRSEPGKIGKMNVIGDVRGKIAIIVDDQADTCGTLTEAGEKLIEAGAPKVFASVTHAVFSEGAVEKINNSSIEKMIVTDTLPFDSKDKSKKIITLSVSKIFSDAIKNIHAEKSVSELFKILT
jgi:ribose-phosphate pyrophosphokinase